jgi:hypothetical protein
MATALRNNNLLARAELQICCVYERFRNSLLLPPRLIVPRSPDHPLVGSADGQAGVNLGGGVFHSNGFGDAKLAR